MTVENIAKERGLTVGTIESHLAKHIEEGRISIYSVIPKEDVDFILNEIGEMPPDFSSKDLFDRLEGRFSYGRLRAVMNHRALDLPLSATE